MVVFKILLLVAIFSWNAQAFSLSLSSPIAFSQTRKHVNVKNAFSSGLQQSHYQRKHHGSLFMSSDDDPPKKRKVDLDPLVKETSLLLRRLSWLSWWAQVVLTTVSSVTLLFTRNVIQKSTTASTNVVSLPNFVLAGSGIVLAFGSIFWTWATRRLARRLLKKPTSRIQAAKMLRKDITIGVTINILGMLLTILGAEQIIGALAIKVLTTTNRPQVSLLDTNMGLQPLDILVVQANTNTLFSHFCSLVALLYLTTKVCKLDPPSVEGDERKR
jgi:hypothetical protein